MSDHAIEFSPDEIVTRRSAQLAVNTPSGHLGGLGICSTSIPALRSPATQAGRSSPR
jgi:hypothetical protein